MDRSYELFDHTADMGLRVRAGSLPELIPPATDALYAAIGDIVAADGFESFGFDGRESDTAVLLRDYLGELLVLFERDARVVTEFESIGFDENRLLIRATSAIVDATRSVWAREVKAITYHELAIRTIEGGFEATLIVDI